MGALGGRKWPDEIQDCYQRTEAFFNKLPITIIPSQPDRFGWGGSYVLPKLRRHSGKTAMRRHSREIGLIIWNAATTGVLSALRQCHHCHTWFAVWKTGHKFCSSKCQLSAFRTTDSGRVKRAKYMREYNARLKKRDEENLNCTKRKR